MSAIPVAADWFVRAWSGIVHKYICGFQACACMAPSSSNLFFDGPEVGIWMCCYVHAVCRMHPKMLLGLKLLC